MPGSAGGIAIMKRAAISACTDLDTGLRGMCPYLARVRAVLGLSEDLRVQDPHIEYPVHLRRDIGGLLEPLCGAYGVVSTCMPQRPAGACGPYSAIGLP